MQAFQFCLYFRLFWVLDNGEKCNSWFCRKNPPQESIRSAHKFTKFISMLESLLHTEKEARIWQETTYLTTDNVVVYLVWTTFISIVCSSGTLLLHFIDLCYTSERICSNSRYTSLSFVTLHRDFWNICATLYRPLLHFIEFFVTLHRDCVTLHRDSGVTNLSHIWRPGVLGLNCPKESSLKLTLWIPLVWIAPSFND